MTIKLGHENILVFEKSPSVGAKSTKSTKSFPECILSISQRTPTLSKKNIR